MQIYNNNKKYILKIFTKSSHFKPSWHMPAKHPLLADLVTCPQLSVRCCRLQPPAEQMAACYTSSRNVCKRMVKITSRNVH